MLENVTVIFTDMRIMMGKLKKKTYEANMNIFNNKYGSYISEITGYVSGAQDKNKAADEVAEVFCTKVADEFMKGKKKMSASKMLDLNLFMIYYVFTAIELSKDANAKLINDTLRDKWNSVFGVKIDYTEYQEIYDSFNEKLFGLF